MSGTSKFSNKLLLVSSGGSGKDVEGGKWLRKLSYKDNKWLIKI